MLFETNKCVGCSVCLKACKDEYVGNDFPNYSASQPNTGFGVTPSAWPNQASKLAIDWRPGQNWMDSSEVITGTFPNIKVRYVYQPCMMCDNAPCFTASANNAVTMRPDGILLIDPVKSKNDAQLPGSCPYNRIYWNAADSIAQKCTVCAHLVDQGKNPKCVDVCPMSAITFGDISDPNSTISKKIASLNAQPLHPEYGAKPKVFYAGLT